MRELLPGIFSWSSFNEERKLNFNGFLFRSDEGAVLVDPPPFSPDDEAAFVGLGLWPGLLVITNRHHVRNRAWFLERGALPTAMRAEEAADHDFKPERALQAGDLLPGGLEVVDASGKTPGEIGLFDRRRRLLMLGDALIGAPAGSVRWVPPDKIMDAARLKDSLKRLLALDFDALILGDGEPILGGAKGAVERFLGGLRA